MSNTVEILRVENATPSQIDEVAALLVFWHEESGLAAWSDAKVAACIHLCLKNGAIVVAKSDGVIVGAMGIAVGQFWYSDEHLVNEYFTIVHPDHRCSNHAKQLITEARRAARVIGVPLLAVVNTTVRTEGKCRLYRRLLAQTGAIFMDIEATNG